MKIVQIRRPLKRQTPNPSNQESEENANDQRQHSQTVNQFILKFNDYRTIFMMMKHMRAPNYSKIHKFNNQFVL